MIHAVSSAGVRRSGSCTYSFHPEAAASVHHLKEFFVLLTSEKVQARNLEVRPEMAHVVNLAFHRIGVHVGKSAPSRLRIEDLLGQLVLFVRVLRIVFGQILRRDRALLRRPILVVAFLRLHEHLPQSLARQVVRPLVGASIAEDVWHGLLQLLDGNRKAVSFVRACHGDEGIVSDIAEVLDLGFHAPVPLVLLQELVLVEEAGVEATHVVVRLHAAVHDGLVALLSDALFRDVDIHPVRIAPVFGSNLAELDVGGRVISDRVLEGLVEGAIIQEDVWVVKPTVEMPLHALDALNHPLQLLVPRQHDKGSIRALALRLERGVGAPSMEHLVVLFANLADTRWRARGY